MLLAVEINQNELVRACDQIVENVNGILENANENDLFITTDDRFKDTIFEFTGMVPKKGIILRKGWSPK